MLENGYGVPINKKEAEHYYTLADESGNKDALYLLGMMHINNNQPYFICHMSKASGIVHLTKAADKGHIEANYQLGHNIYIMMVLVFSVNKIAAFNSFKKAADLEHDDAMIMCGYMLFNGDGIPKDIENALIYYKKKALIVEIQQH